MALIKQNNTPTASVRLTRAVWTNGASVFLLLPSVCNYLHYIARAGVCQVVLRKYFRECRAGGAMRQESKRERKRRKEAEITAEHLRIRAVF